MALGLALVAYRGWPVLAIGMASLLAALAYMGGPRPIAYTPFGELTVFVFFGLVAVIGTDWVLTGSVGAVSAAGRRWRSAAWRPRRWRSTTTATSRTTGWSGRRTFAVELRRARPRAACITLLLLAPFALLPVMALVAARAGAAAAAAAAAGGAGSCGATSSTARAALAFNEVLFRTFRLELWFAALLSAGALLGRMLG